MHRRLAEFISRIAGVDGDYLVRNGFWVSARYAIVSLIGLVTTIVFTRLASQEVYGAYQYVLSFVAFFSFLSLPGMNMAALKSVVNNNDRPVFQAIRLSFLSGLLSIPCIIGYGLYHDGAQDLPGLLLIFTAFLSVPFYAFNTWYVFYEGRQDFFSVGWRAVAAAFISFLVVCTLLFTGASLTTLVTGYFLTGSVLSILFTVEVWLRSSSWTNNPGSSQGEAIDVRYGLAVTGQKLVLNASETLPIMVVGAFYGFADVAVFQVALFVYSSIGGYVGALVAMYLPRIFAGIRLERGRMLTHNLISGVLISGVAAFFMLFAFPLFFDARYSESARIIAYLLPAIALLPIKTYLTSYFMANHKISLTITTYLIANLFAFLAFSLVREQGAGIAGGTYINTLIFATVLPLAFVYYFFETASKKIASI